MVKRQGRTLVRMKNDKLRILHVHGDLQAGGGQVLSRDWLSSIDRTRFEPFVVVLGAPTTLKDSFEEKSIPVTEIFGNRIFQIFKLTKYITTNKIDIVHTQSELDRKVGHLAALITRRPVIAHAHSEWVYFASKSQSSGFIRKLRSYLAYRIRIVSERSVACFVATSEPVQKSFIQFTSKPVFLVEPGRHKDKLSRLTSNKIQNKIALGINREKKLIVNASRLDDLKNLDDFILAIAKMRTEINVIGHIYGEGENKAKLEKLISDIDCEESIKILEPILDLKPIFEAADLFLATSISESFGMSVLESLSAGLPVVAYNLETYSRYGDAITQVDLFDLDGLIDQSLRVLNDEELYNDLVEKGLEASKNYDIAIGTQKLQDIYQKYAHNFEALELEVEKI